MIAATRNAASRPMSADGAIGPVAAPQRSFGRLALRLRVSGVLAFLLMLGASSRSCRRTS